MCQFAIESRDFQCLWKDFFGRTQEDLQDFIKIHKVEGKWVNELLVRATSLFLGQLKRSTHN